jgi:glycosyltransferase involved in cell wall biosynthesis
MTTVLHTMQRYLPLSEQFVHTLITRSSFRGVVVSREPAENRDAFPFKPVHALGMIKRHDPPSNSERRLLTAAYSSIALAHRAKLVHQHHGYRMSDVAGMVRRMIVPSRYLIPAVEKLSVPAERIHVLPSGVDTSFFSPSPLPGDPVALFVGRFVEKKGLDVLLKAWPGVRRAVPGARLLLLGYGPLESLARSGGEGVEVLPAQASRRAEQVRDAIRSARVIVTPSRTADDGDVETLLLVNLEAQASGRPVVTTRHGGIPEFVDEGRTALVVEENDPEALAVALARVLSEDDFAVAMAAAGPGWASRFDWTERVAAVDDLYRSLLR